MRLGDLAENWEKLGQSDPLWAVLSLDDKAGSRWSPDEFLAYGPPEITDLLKRLDEAGVTFPRREALDFGCGAGRLTQALADHFDHVVGVDIAPSMIAQADSMNRRGEKCEFVVNQSPNLSLLDGRKFDLIYTSIVLQHIAPILSRGYIREFVRLLSPDGVAAFHVPTRPPGQWVKLLIPEPVLNARRRLLGHRGPVMQMWGLRPETVEREVVAAGGQLVDRIASAASGNVCALHEFA